MTPAVPAATASGGGAASPGEVELVTRLRAGEEAAFTALVEMYHASMVRLATAYVPDRSIAEDVAQEAWVGVLKGIDRFEGRSSLKTWIFRILTNTAKTRGERESRTVAFSVAFDDPPDEGASVDPDRFHAYLPFVTGHWKSSTAPREWLVSPEESVLSAETQGCIRDAMGTLPVSQREVLRLRDIEGWTAEEVCNTLSLSETNQRVLLHRARSKVRKALEAYMAGRRVR